MLITARKIIQVKQKPVSRYPFLYILSYFNTRTWYLHRLFRTYKVRGVWISKHISWYCDTIIWYCPVEPIPQVGTFRFNISTKICCWDTNNSYFWTSCYQMITLDTEFLLLIFQWMIIQWRTFQWMLFQWRTFQWRTISGGSFIKEHWKVLLCVMFQSIIGTNRFAKFLDLYFN